MATLSGPKARLGVVRRAVTRNALWLGNSAVSMPMISAFGASGLSFTKAKVDGGKYALQRRKLAGNHFDRKAEVSVPTALDSIDECTVGWFRGYRRRTSVCWKPESDTGKRKPVARLFRDACFRLTIKVAGSLPLRVDRADRTIVRPRRLPQGYHDPTYRI